MAKMKMDALDASLLVLNSMAGFIVVGIGTFDLFDVDFGEVLWTIGPAELSTAWVLGYAAIVATIVTNDNAQFGTLSNDIQNLDTWYAVAAAGTLLLPIAYVLSPDMIGGFFESADLWGLLYVVIITAGQGALGWLL